MKTGMEKGETRWQLEVFSRGLKKNQKLKMLLKHLRDVSGQRCLLLTCGDNNGAINHYFRQAGGQWTWADVGQHGGDPIREMEAFLGEKVHLAQPQALPFPDEAFDRVVVIDVHEHVSNPQPLTAEIYRIVKRGGRAIVTVPNGNPWKPAVIIKNGIGMTKDEYGHQRIGYRLRELKQLMAGANFVPYATGGYSGFFTEMAELGINFLYVKVLSKRHKTVKVSKGVIAPSSPEQLQAVSGAYKMYSRIFPVLKAISSLDWLMFFDRHYAVMVAGEKR